MKKKQKLSKKHYPDISNVVSAGECTGSVPTPPQNDAESRSYSQLIGKEIPKNSNDN